MEIRIYPILNTRRLVAYLEERRASLQSAGHHPSAQLVVMHGASGIFDR